MILTYAFVKFYYCPDLTRPRQIGRRSYVFWSLHSADVVFGQLGTTFSHRYRFYSWPPIGALYPICGYANLYVINRFRIERPFRARANNCVKFNDIDFQLTFDTLFRTPRSFSHLLWKFEGQMTIEPTLLLSKTQIIHCLRVTFKNSLRR